MEAGFVEKIKKFFHKILDNDPEHPYNSCVKAMFNGP